MTGPRKSWWKRGVAAVALLLLLLAIYIGATLPPRTATLATSMSPTIRFGGYHIHTDRSDGAWAVDDVAAAAARAGLHFIVLADHGDATRAPDPPAYRHGVLVIDAVEISTADGHVVALNLDTPSPYPLGGRAREVIEDIHRLGGWAVVAHPDSAKKELRWTAWDTPYDGVEWINADSEWRDESKLRLAATALRAMVRGPESIVTLFKRPDVTIARWTDDLKKRPVVALGAMDAHGALPFANAMLRTVWQGVTLDAGLTGSASDDAHRVLEAMRRGRTFTLIPAIASPAALEFSATQGEVAVRPGDRLNGVTVPVTFQASVAGAPEAFLELFLDRNAPIQFKGEPGFATGKGSFNYRGTPYPGAYHVETAFTAPSPPWGPSDKPYIHTGPPAPRYLPWMFSNPIFVDGPPAPLSPIDIPDPTHIGVRAALPRDHGWGVEHAPGSRGEVNMDGASLRFAFQLGSEMRSNPYAALVASVDFTRQPIRGIVFEARAERPTRVSVQVRVPDGSVNGLRWGRSIYVDDTRRTFAISIADLEQIGDVPRQLPADAIRSLMFVVDTINAAPGSHGTVWISNPGVSPLVPR